MEHGYISIRLTYSGIVHIPARFGLVPAIKKNILYYSFYSSGNIFFNLNAFFFSNLLHHYNSIIHTLV